MYTQLAWIEQRSLLEHDVKTGLSCQHVAYGCSVPLIRQVCGTLLSPGMRCCNVVLLLLPTLICGRKLTALTDSRVFLEKDTSKPRIGGIGMHWAYLEYPFWPLRCFFLAGSSIICRISIEAQGLCPRFLHALYRLH